MASVHCAHCGRRHSIPPGGIQKLLEQAQNGDMHVVTKVWWNGRRIVQVLPRCILEMSDRNSGGRQKTRA